MEPKEVELKDWMTEHMPQKCKSSLTNNECPKLKTCTGELNKRIGLKHMTKDNSSMKDIYALIEQNCSK